MGGRISRREPMNLLLDTHVLIWFASNSDRLGEQPRALLAEAAERHVSAASAHEIAVKTRLGKLRGGQQVLDGWSRLLRNLQADELPLDVSHMTRAGLLDWAHRDPFDRMLVAQAQLEGLTLLTDDSVVRDHTDVRTRWS